MIELRTLGGSDLRSEGGEELRAILAQPKRLGLLVHLALAGTSGFRRRDSLVAMFWPELDAEHARGALRQALRFLRRELGEGVVITRGDEDVGIDAAALWCDAVAFEDASASNPAIAVELYRGDFLDGFHVDNAATELERWLETTRTDLRRRAMSCLWSLARTKRDAGARAEASALARRAASLAPEDEAQLRSVLAFLDESGDRAGAVAAYQEFAERLREDHDAEPSPETQALMRRIRERTAVGAGLLDVDARPTPPVPVADAAPHAAGEPRPKVRSRARTVRRGTFLLATALAAAGIAGTVRNRGAPRPTSIAVLPLELIGADTTERYLADGVTADLITALAQGGPIRVVNRQTMLRYRGTTKPARDIARELHVDEVLSGTIERIGDSVHMTAQLVDANDDRTVWAQSLLGSRGDLLQMQRLVARSVRQTVHGAATHASSDGAAKVAALDPIALDRYVRGRYWWNKRGPGLLTSIDFFTKALDVDPTFALAYSGLADAYVQLGYGSLLRPDDAFPKARAAAERALALDSTLAEPHATLGYVNMYYAWDWRAAEREFRRALVLDPSYATGHEWYGLFLAAMGRTDEAIAEERRAQELDPLSTAVAGTSAWVQYYGGRFDAADRELRVALREDPGFALGHFYLGRVHESRGDLKAALAEYDATGPLQRWVPTIAARGRVLALSGRTGEARATIAEMDAMSRNAYVTAYAMALVHAALGQRDSAFAWLDRGVAERTHWLVWLNRDPRWQSIRGDPRFAALVKRVGLPP